jgi:hypothetical protein
MPQDFTEGNQLEAYEIVSNQVKALLKGGTFLQNGRDENVSSVPKLSTLGLTLTCVSYHRTGQTIWHTPALRTYVFNSSMPETMHWDKLSQTTSRMRFQSMLLPWL